MHNLAQFAEQAAPTMLEHARELARSGFTVFPLEHAGKKPIGQLAPHGVKNATTDQSQIFAWWTACPDANIGIAVPDGCVVIDVDPRNGGEQSYEALHPLPSTLTANTGGGGVHLWFRLPAGLTLPGKLGAGIDLKQLGGYVVAPPSRHPSGQLYVWTNFVAIADAPKWLTAMARARGERGAATIVDDTIDLSDGFTSIGDRIVEVLEPHYVDGHRHHIARGLGGYLKRRGTDGCFPDSGYTPSDAAYVVERLPSNDPLRRVADARWAWSVDNPDGWSLLAQHLPPAALAELERAVPNRVGKRIAAMFEGAMFQSTPANELAATPFVAPTSSTGFDPFLGSQQGDAERFSREHGGSVRWIPAWEKFVAWDGKRWSVEQGELLARKAWQKTLRAMFDEAKASELNTEAAQRAVKYVQSRMSRGAEDAVIALCKSRLATSHTTFDRNPYTLNVLNGLLDLRTGELRPHAPAALCTKLANVEWSPGAACPRWLGFINWAMQDDRELVSYLQRFFGLCLTGDASFELLHAFFGDGANGKTTSLVVLERMLGDYAGRAPAKLLIRARNEAHPTETSNFHGRRLMILAETEEDKELDEQALKTLASKDPITTRQMRQDFWSFDPTHKAVLMTNYRPRVRGQDKGLWRRIRLVPWLATVAEENKDASLPDRLFEEAPGVLQWCFQGLQAVLREGLKPPGVVSAATDDYQRSEDSVRRFLEAEHYVLQTDLKTPAGQLIAGYTTWADKNREPQLSARGLAARLQRLGCEAGRTNGERYWKGVGRLTGFGGVP